MNSKVVPQIPDPWCTHIVWFPTLAYWQNLSMVVSQLLDYIMLSGKWWWASIPAMTVTFYKTPSWPTRRGEESQRDASAGLEKANVAMASKYRPLGVDSCLWPTTSKKMVTVAITATQKWILPKTRNLEEDLSFRWELQPRLTPWFLPGKILSRVPTWPLPASSARATGSILINGYCLKQRLW